MRRLLLTIIHITVYMLDITWFWKKSGWLFHGYNGQPVGNNFALAHFVNETFGAIDEFYWVGVKRPSELPSEFSFRNVPARSSPLWQHISFMFFLIRMKIISLEGAGDLSFYIRFLAKRGRLIVLLPHGLTLKSSGILAKNLSASQKHIWHSMEKRFHLISAASKLEAYMISSTFNFPIENVLVMGCQRAVAEGPYGESDKRKAKELVHSTYGECKGAEKLIVYAPTHRDHKDSHEAPVLFGFQDYQSLNEALLMQNSRLIIRTHSLAESLIDGEFSQISLGSSKPVVDFNLLAPAVDVLITDYSGIFIEFLKSDIRMAFWQYDLREYIEERGLSMPDSIFSVGFSIKGPDDFLTLLASQADDDEKVSAKKHWANALSENSQSEALEKTVREISKRAGVHW